MKDYTNPIIPTETDGHTADPHVTRHNGFYYHCYCRHDGVYISKASKLWDIGKGEEKRVYKGSLTGVDSQWFAPELHFLDGAWYIYGAPVVDETTNMHTMCVLENKSSDPMGDYTNLGIVKGMEGKWSIDGTILENNGERWFVWTKCKEMYIVRMDTPTSVTGEHFLLMKPELEFETKCGLINEGGAVLYRNGKIHIVFSANDSRCDDYCLGVMTYNGGDIKDRSNWTKHPKAFFEKTEDIFGPGHCSFTTVTENGTEVDYMVYHANLESGSGWTGRSVWVQPFSWDEDDMPVFGKPMR